MSQFSNQAPPAAAGPRPPERRLPQPTLPTEQTVREVSRLMDHLRTQLEELDRREANLNRQFVSLDNERRTLRLAAQEQDQKIELRDRDLTSRETAVVDREAAIVSRTADLDARERTLQDSQQLLDAERSEFRQQLQREFADEREELLEQRRQQDAREQGLETRDQTLTQQAVDLDKRTRFHEDHLQKLRKEIASQRSELDRQRQRQRTWALEVDESIRFRLSQIRRFRDLLERREQTFDAECELFRQQRVAAQNEAARERDALAEERVSLAAQTEAQLAENRRQQDLLIRHSATLDARRQRLDALRDELEQSHQELLEGRLAVEQATAELVRQSDPETAQAGVQQARETLFNDYRDLRESLIQRRQEADEAIRKLVATRDEFRAERDTQVQRTVEREELLAGRERAMAEQSLAAAEREKEWLAAQAQWRDDKLEAERIIRELLEQLEGVVAPDGDRDSGLTAQSVVPLPPDAGLAADAEPESGRSTAAAA
ncbi:MAG: hypothetical protein KF774_07620 [Planctomyces sp.]|nr:hypothetical protein [Planctomyces sp.]